MTLLTTLYIATIIILGAYLLVKRLIPWPPLSYFIIIAFGVACLLQGDVHFRYIGIEIAGAGSLLVWVHYQFIQKLEKRLS